MPNANNENVGILALLQARPGKEAAVKELLVGALALAREERFTQRWYAVQVGPQTFAIFDTFANDAGRTSHLEGKIAQELMARADELLAVTPDIRKVDVLAVK